jgi:hypothetical protein
MAVRRPRPFLSGAALVWRHQRVLWLLYFANLLLALAGTRAVVDRTGEILNHSLAADSLVHGFDLGLYSELRLHPSLPFSASRPLLLYSSLLFALFMLFATGGVLAAYYEDHRLDAGGFCQACGGHFWRFLRLMIYFVIALIPIGILAWLAGALFHKVNQQAISPFPAVHLLEIAATIIVLLVMCLRLWFDVAQVIAVAEGEKNMRRALKSSARLLRHNFSSLFWLYFRISVLGWIGFALGMHLWLMRIPPEGIRASFVLSQAAIVFWLAIRLWQRASEARWYRERDAALDVPEPVVEPSPSAPVTSEPQLV